MTWVVLFKVASIKGVGVSIVGVRPYCALYQCALCVMALCTWRWPVPRQYGGGALLAPMALAADGRLCMGAGLLEFELPRSPANSPHANGGLKGKELRALRRMQPRALLQFTGTQCPWPVQWPPQMGMARSTEPSRPSSISQNPGGATSRESQYYLICDSNC